MNFKQGIAKLLLTLTATFASVTTTLADPDFNVYSNTSRATNGNYFFCDQDESGRIRILALNDEAELIDRINVEVYTKASYVGDVSKAVAVYTNQRPKDIKHNVNRTDIDPTGKASASKTYYVRITLADGSEGSWTSEITFDAIHVDDQTLPEIEPYCVNKMPVSVSNLISKYSTSKYHWYDSEGKTLDMVDFLTIGKLPEGVHTYTMQVKENRCYSPGIQVSLHVLGNSAPNLNKSYVTYVPSDISGGSYTKSILKQAYAQYGVDLVDNPDNCELIWKDKSGNVISNFENYIPPVPTTYGTTIDQYSVSKDCGCGSPSKEVSFYVFKYVAPKPTVEDLLFCVDDSHAADGFDATIGMTSEAGETESNYLLEFSKNADMSDAIALPAGAKHFDYTFDVSVEGTTTYYVRQKQIASGEYSEVVTFDVVVKRPAAPTLTDQKVCANTTKSIPLSTICNESGLIWKDAEDNAITGSVPTEKRGNITVSAKKSETINGELCYSNFATATIRVDSLKVDISGDNTLLPEQTGKAELTIEGSGSQTIKWTCDVSNTIIGSVNKSDISVKMDVLDITLTAVVTDEACSQSVNWTIVADLFKCPKPTANDVALCINDPRAADGFDANITLENSADSKLNYTLAVSKNADMSGAIKLAAGETHFNYTFNASTVGTQTIYIQQTELSRNLSSAIVPVNVKISQPAIPSTKAMTICLNDNSQIQLSKLSDDSNIQWYDKDKNELTSTASFNKRGKYPFYAKRYEMVNGQKCWSELTSVDVTVDSIGIEINGDNHLCPDSEGNVTIKGTATSLDNIKWTCDSPSSISNASSPTVNVKMGNKDLNLNYAVSAGGCKTNGTWNITVGSGKVSGNIKFTEDSKIRTFSSLSNVVFSSCGGRVTVEATLEHTSSDFTVKKGNSKIGTYSFAGDVAKFEIEGAGTYSVIYENDCETSFSFNVTVMTIQPSVQINKWSSCYGGYISAEINNVDECKVIWKRDGIIVGDNTKSLKINNVSATNIGNYTYELVCDGCPANGIVSAKQPDIYAPLEVTITKSADTICQGSDMVVDLHISPNSDKVSYSWTTGNDIKTANNGASATMSPYYTKSYNVVIKNGDCAQQTKTVKVNVQPQMTGDIDAGSIMCEGDSTVLDASNMEAEEYIWGHTDDPSPIITVVPTGVENKYTLTAIKKFCTIEKEFILMVGATPKLASVDSIGLDDVKINMESTGEYLFIVDGKDKAIDAKDNVKNHVGFGEHTLSIIDVAGCKTDTSFYIFEPPLEIQNYFIPGSDGENATFKIPDAVIVYSSTTMNIYDRWGKKLVTLTSDDTDGWDGTYNGKPLPSSDYWYELNVDVIDKTYFGHFTLIRE